MEAPALRLGASIKHIMSKASRLLIIFEAKQGSSYAPGGSGARRDIDLAMADFPFLDGSGI